jgi:hypothetical protein
MGAFQGIFRGGQDILTPKLSREMPLFLYLPAFSKSAIILYTEATICPKVFRFIVVYRFYAARILRGKKSAITESATGFN